MIVSLVQTKGGTAKSTLSQCLAFAKPIRQRFDAIGLVELDEQGTLERWWQARRLARRANGQVTFHHLVGQDIGTVQESMIELAESHDLLILDVPGESVSRFHTAFACAASDLVIVPMRTSTNDEEAFEHNLLPIIRDIQHHHPERKGRFVILPTFTHPRASLRKIVNYFNNILPPEITCLDAVFPFRSVFENFNREGLNLQEYMRLVKTNARELAQVKKAEQDITRIASELLKGAA